MEFYIMPEADKDYHNQRAYEFVHELIYGEGEQEDVLRRLTQMIGVMRQTQFDFAELRLFWGDPKRTLLHEAAGAARPGIIPALIEAGIKADQGDANGASPLFYVDTDRNHHTGNCLIESIQALVANGATLDHEDHDGNRPLHYTRTDEAFDALVRAGADPTKQNKKGEIPQRPSQRHMPIFRPLGDEPSTDEVDQGVSRDDVQGRKRDDPPTGPSR
jgi:hypothetical protein